MSCNKFGLSTAALHTEIDGKHWQGSKAVVPPVSMSKIHRLDGPDEPADGALLYTRYGNPTTLALQATLAKLEGSAHAFAFASGMAAATAVVITLLRQGDHVVAGSQIYGGNYDMLKEYLPQIGVDRTFCTGRDLDEFRRALTPKTKLVWFEACSNPVCKVFDIPRIAKIAHEYNKDIVVLVDNTILTPYVYRPLEDGADIVLHSISKYLNGHTDLIMGCLMFNDDTLAKEIYETQKKKGLHPAPFDAFLAHRSLTTFEIRMQRHEANALQVAKFLETHPQVESVRHPQLKSHPDHDLAQKLFGDRYSGMIALYLKGGEHAARTFLDKVRVVTMAASLGCSISIANIPALISHVDLTDEERKESEITKNLVRFSVGLENVEDIIADLKHALDAIAA